MPGSPLCRTRSARGKLRPTRATGLAAFRIANRFEKPGLAMPPTDAVKLRYRAPITALARRLGAPNSYARLLSLRISLERFDVYSAELQARSAAMVEAVWGRLRYSRQGERREPSATSPIFVVIAGLRWAVAIALLALIGWGLASES